MNNQQFDDFDFFQIGNEIENNKIPGMERELYIYPIKSIFKNIDANKELITYSPYTENLRIIDLDDVKKIKAELIENPQYSYNSKQSLSNMDGELAIVSKYDKFYTTTEDFEYNPNKLYLVSEFEIKTDIDIETFGQIIQTFTSKTFGEDNLNLSRELTIGTTLLSEWKPRDANNLIIKIGKELNKTMLSKIKIKTPKSFLISSLKAVNSEKGISSYISLEPQDVLFPLWINPINISNSKKIDVINYWMSDRIFALEEAKRISDSNHSSFEISKLLEFSDEEAVSKETISANNVEYIKIDFPEIFYDVKKGKQTGSWKGSSVTYGKDKYENRDNWPIVNDRDNRDELGSRERPNLYSLPYQLLYANTFYRFEWFEKNLSIQYVLDNSIKPSSLTELLKDVLNASYNYSMNFKGAGYTNEQTKELNKMALYKQEFEGKTISEYIDGLEKSWEQAHPNKIDSTQYSNYKKIRTMLSPYIFGTNSIGNNKQDDARFLLPYWFELTSKPVYDIDGNISDQTESGRGLWKYKNINVKLKSLYFNLENKTPNKMKNSKQLILTGNNDTFIWQNPKEVIEESKLPGLKNSDFKTSDINVTKYLLYTRTNIINYLGSGKSLIFNKEDFDSMLEENILTFESKIAFQSLNFLELSGLFLPGNYSLEFIDANGNTTLKINDLIFSRGEKEDVSAIKIIF
ncbi:hypothetical protein [Mesoplasma lactucae]|uniref:Uncharacterized protein n=1 Tax=Mesoplasma lactucae ATCC 49193 TaxID=81460 RepID=A0A291IRX7_9MOLU|nr:hypothetical protein [Mesoplasma lactucae]ATG97498.1 hypothetical protein CP520_01890 [Mesoplasma lactucae ATCC 49193]ATZ20046.1 hypothetical protein MLACT_v1c02240 [Mesoplasma lactucae ATCC 49193]MCL8217003.1 hypothetical protein [Mesoplasma lactucae ATCC 49193]